MGSRLEYLYRVPFNHIHQISLSFFLHQIQIMRCSSSGLFNLRAARTWNKLPDITKKQTTVNAFKNAYDSWKREKTILIIAKAATERSEQEDESNLTGNRGKHTRNVVSAMPNEFGLGELSLNYNLNLYWHTRCSCAEIRPCATVHV